MAVPTGQIAARGVAGESQAMTVARAHDRSASLCEDNAAWIWNRGHAPRRV